MHIRDFSGNSTSDHDLERLSGRRNLESIRELILCDASITDAGLVHLRGMTNLQTLDLSNTVVTDDGLAELENLANLQQLGLMSAHITDAGLDHLKHLRQLNYVDLTGTPITNAGLAKFQREHPECVIVRAWSRPQKWCRSFAE